MPTDANANTVRATVSTVDPYVLSSVKYGDPKTPLLRAYAGDQVVIRTIGLAERAEALRIQGHRFRMERFNAAGQSDGHGHDRHLRTVRLRPRRRRRRPDGQPG